MSDQKDIRPSITTPTAEEIRAVATGDDALLREMSAKTRRAFVVGGLAALAGAATWKWLDTRPREGGVGWPYRRGLELNENLAMGYYSNARLSPTFDARSITRNRVNGHLGLAQAYDAKSWNLTIENSSLDAGPIVVTLDEIMKLPKREMITELRCIEGWSIIVKWTGARLSDLIARYPPRNRDGSRGTISSPEQLVRYAALESPGRGYYVGLDMASTLHPQTLLAYAMNDTPLDWHHGAPIRLSIPVKYGIKNIKRPVTLRYSDVRPADFWAEQGYDWYAGH
jgi:DMSO/TMAO reductase YedYZ molybdopterin-dependent catalytic subunit